MLLTVTGVTVTVIRSMKHKERNANKFNFSCSYVLISYNMYSGSFADIKVHVKLSYHIISCCILYYWCVFSMILVVAAESVQCYMRSTVGWWDFVELCWFDFILRLAVALIIVYLSAVSSWMLPCELKNTDISRQGFKSCLKSLAFWACLLVTGASVNFV